MHRRCVQGWAASAAAVMVASAGYAVNTPEVEPNDNKSGAQLVVMSCDDTITGNTTGTSTTVSGPASADYFRVRTVGTGALTEYTLTMTSGAATPLQAMTVRGLTQTGGTPNAGTDVAVQTATTVGSTKVCRWYGTGGAGQNQDVYVAVTGTASSTSDYTLTLTCTPVTATPMTGGTLASGTISVVPDTATSTAIDTDWWVYDGGFNPVPTFGHDDADTTAVSRTLGNGTFYIAIANYNVCNDQGSPADDTFRIGAVMDFPNVLAQSTTANYTTVNMTATDGAVTVTGTGSRPNPFEVVWYSFQVAPPSVPIGSGAANPSSAQITTTTLLTVAVTPAANPTSTGITVVGNLSSINGPGTQSFYDDGSHGDQAAGDGTYSYLATLSEPLTAGPQTIPFTVGDSQGRSSSGNISLTLTAAPTGACCSGTSCSVMTAYNCGQGGGSYTGNGTNCGAVSYSISDSQNAYVDISSTGTMTTTTSDCDDCTESIALPFSFTFFDNAYTSVFVSSNGNLQFGATASTAYTNGNIPTAGAPNSAIYVDWDDMNTTTAGDIFYQTDGAAPNRTFTVAWNHVSQYTAGGAYPATDESFEVVLHEGTNNIELRYGTISGPCSSNTGQCTAVGPDGDDRTVGVENSTGTVAYSVGGAAIGSGNVSKLLTYTLPANPCTPRCGSADFNCDGDTGTDADIEAFFACLAGNCPAAPCPNNADFNADGDTGTDADIEAFFRVLAGGTC